nr:MAG TPA: Nigerythrin, Rubredoxin, Hemerythrin, Peroxidase, Electron.6A [Bacteriophage sp.]
MPDEYISREAALADFESCNAENPNWTPQRVKTLLLRQPAADVAEVVYGQWIGEGDGYADGVLVCDVWHCSVCDYTIDDGTDDPARLPKYCAGCGVKMDGGNDDATD